MLSLVRQSIGMEGVRMESMYLWYLLLSDSSRRLYRNQKDGNSEVILRTPQSNKPTGGRFQFYLYLS